MFSLREFIKIGLLKAIGNMSEYKIRLNAAGWLGKGVLEEADLAEIQAAIDAAADAQYVEINPEESEGE